MGKVAKVFGGIAALASATLAVAPVSASGLMMQDPIKPYRLQDPIKPYRQDPIKPYRQDPIKPYRQDPIKPY